MKSVSTVQRVGALVIGGGAAGCVVASRIASANIETLIVERGADIRKAPSWHTGMPAAKIIHRLEHRYEKAEQTDSPVSFRGTTANVSIPTPSVLGGMSSMGSRSWIRASKEDMKTIPLTQEEILRGYMKYENVEAETSSHRGTHGKLFQFRPQSTNPLYRPFAEAASALRHPLVGDFNKPQLEAVNGVGRPETLVDPFVLRSSTVLSGLVNPAVASRRPLSIDCQSTVTSLAIDGDRVVGVEVTNSDGSKRLIHADLVVLTAGAIGNAKLLTAASTAASLPAEAQASNIGKGFWDTFTYTMQYETVEPISLHFMTSKLPQLMEYLFWYNGKQGMAMSSYDDFVFLHATKGQSHPNIRANLQPFLLNNDGVEGGKHGFQVVVQLTRPRSKGYVNQEKVHPGYLEEAADAEALEEGVQAVEEILNHPKFSPMKKGPAISSFLGSQGVNGGTLALGRCVDPGSFLLKGMKNLYIADSSVVPEPVYGDLMPLSLLMAETCADTILRLRSA